MADHPRPRSTDLRVVLLLRALYWLPLWIAACGAPGGEADAPCAPPAVEAQAPGILNAYACAALVRLPERSPLVAPGLVNVFRLSENVISGSEPTGPGAFEQLARWGVRTVISVDGKTPDARAARAVGIETVHLPIRYSGLSDDQVLSLAKTFREARPPFYVHCFHGRHRGPAAAAVGRLVLDGASREQVVAEMRQWCGTSEKYEGLYRDLLRSPIPTASQTAAFAYDFPEACRPEGLRGAMSEMARVFDALELLAASGWEADREHPDLDARSEARHLVELFEACERSQAAVDRQGLAVRLSVSLEGARDLEALLVELENGQAAAPEAAEEAFEALARDCASCHRAHRNR
jgi:protein tyrosine phosphatase (PTP) superfamily phosphohydrolase (DUF442 family)